MGTKHRYVLAAAALVVALPLLATSENINYQDINKIKAEGMSAQRSQVMELNSWLSDVYAPRVTGSPTIEKAAQWAMGKMKEWGLENVKMEPWTNRNGIDRGWTNDKFYMEAVSPERFPIPGTPTAWTPGTNGLASGEVVLVTATTAEELAQYKGKLKGKWVLLQPAPDVSAFWDPPARRYTADQLAAIELSPPLGPEFGVTPPGGARPGAPATPAPARPPGPPAPTQQAAPQGQRPGTPPAGTPAGTPQQPAPARGPGGQGPANVRNDFLRAEGVLGTISTAPRGHGIYTIGGRAQSDPATTLPAVSIAAEQYGRIARMLAKNVAVKIEADIKNTYYPNPPLFNIVGEIPGSDKADEIVMLGAHFDTWHAATGAADNGVGSAAMMEAMRILKQTGVKLRRTVRIGLWEAEEQGLIGSREYVSAHFASQQPAPGAPGAAAAGQRGAGPFGAPQGPLEFKPEYPKFSAYFNIDNGTGALRGIYLQGNDAVAPIFLEWMEPFRSLGMTTLTIRNTGGTDHQSFDRVGLPGFQFIQDEVEYNVVTHHTNMDTYERLQPRDCMQMATIAAGFAYLAANRDEKLPRKPLPVPGQGGRRGDGGQQ
jgi:carboxypeptidase Q